MNLQIYLVRYVVYHHWRHHSFRHTNNYFIFDPLHLLFYFLHYLQSVVVHLRNKHIRLLLSLRNRFPLIFLNLQIHRIHHLHLMGDIRLCLLHLLIHQMHLLLHLLQNCQINRFWLRRVDSFGECSVEGAGVFGGCLIHPSRRPIPRSLRPLPLLNKVATFLRDYEWYWRIFFTLNFFEAVSCCIASPSNIIMKILKNIRIRLRSNIRNNASFDNRTLCWLHVASYFGTAKQIITPRKPHRLI